MAEMGSLEAFERTLHPSEWTRDWDAREPDPIPEQTPAPEPDWLSEAEAALAPPRPEEFFLPASGIEARPVDWLVDGWLPRGELTILSGRPGSQKTTLAAELAAILTTGRPWSGKLWAKPTRPISVLWATSEDSLSRVLVPRLEATGADLSRVYFAREGFSPVSEDGLPRLRDFAEQVPDLGLLILDPLKGFAAPDDGNDEGAVREALVRITRYASETGLSVLGVAHLRKGGARDSLDALAGSLAWGATARSVWVAGRNPDPDEDGFILAHSKCNLGPLQPSIRYEGTSDAIDLPPGEDGFARTSSGLRFEWMGPSALTASDLTDPPKSDSSVPDSTLEAATAWLLEQLLTDSGAPTCTASRVLKITGRAAGFGETALKAAVADSAIQTVHDGRATAWAHPDYRAPEPDPL